MMIKNPFKKRTPVVRITHVHGELRNRAGKKVHALITSFPARKFDDRYDSELHDDPDYLIFEDDNGNPISRRKFIRLARKKRKRLNAQ